MLTSIFFFINAKLEVVNRTPTKLLVYNLTFPCQLNAWGCQKEHLLKFEWKTWEGPKEQNTKILVKLQVAQRSAYRIISVKLETAKVT